MNEVNVYAGNSVKEIVAWMIFGFHNTKALLAGETPRGFPHYYDESAEDIISYHQKIKELTHVLAHGTDLSMQILRACRYDDVDALQALSFTGFTMTAATVKLIMESIEESYSFKCYVFLRDQGFNLGEISLCARCIHFVREDVIAEVMVHISGLTFFDLRRVFFEVVSLGRYAMLDPIYSYFTANFGYFSLDFKVELGDRSLLSEAFRFNHEETALWLLEKGCDPRITCKDHTLDFFALTNGNLSLLRALNFDAYNALSIFCGDAFNENTMALFKKFTDFYPDLIDFLLSRFYVNPGVYFLKSLYRDMNIDMIYAVQSYKDIYRVSSSDFDQDSYVDAGRAIARGVSFIGYDERKFLFSCFPDCCEGMNKLHLFIEIKDDDYFSDFLDKYSGDIIVLLSQEYEDMTPIIMAIKKHNNTIFEKLLAYDFPAADPEEYLRQLILTAITVKNHFAFLLSIERYYSLIGHESIPLILDFLSDEEFIKTLKDAHRNFRTYQVINDLLLSKEFFEPDIFHQLSFLLNQDEINALLDRGGLEMSNQDRLLHMREMSSQACHLLAFYHHVHDNDGPCKQIAIHVYRCRLHHFLLEHESVLAYDVRKKIEPYAPMRLERLQLSYQDLMELIDNSERAAVLARGTGCCASFFAKPADPHAVELIRELRSLCHDKDLQQPISIGDAEKLKIIIQANRGHGAMAINAESPFYLLPIVSQLDHILGVMYNVADDFRSVVTVRVK